MNSEGGSQLTVRYFAGARAAAGVAEDEVLVPPGAPLSAVLDAVRERRGDRLATVLSSCSFLLDGVAVHEHSTPVTGADQLDVLPPFAGG